MVDSNQIDFWKGEFGDKYTSRNSASPEQIRARINLWTKILNSMIGDLPCSILEVGANIGNNLTALKAVSNAKLYAVEPNATARKELIDKVIALDSVYDGTASNINMPDKHVDLVFTSGVLIHIHPDELLKSCKEIYRVANKYIVCIEYFSDKPETILYRGHDDKLFKRDFGAFWLDNFHDLILLDYGFLWKRATGLDNLTWWVFFKRN